MTTAQSQPQEHSIQWNSPLAVKVLGQRTAREDARFMLGELQPGMQVLDCGCGVGSITLGLAAYVPQGFVDVRLTASYTCFGTKEQVAEAAQILMDFALGPSRVEAIVANGWGTAEEIQQIKTDMEAWARSPGAFHMRTWVEAIARKP